jgi:hypothetical protein
VLTKSRPEDMKGKNRLENMAVEKMVIFTWELGWRFTLYPSGSR